MVVSQNGRQFLRGDLERGIAHEQQVTTVGRCGERAEQGADRVADRPLGDRPDERAVRRKLEAEEGE